MFCDIKPGIFFFCDVKPVWRTVARMYSIVIGSQCADMFLEGIVL